MRTRLILSGIKSYFPWLSIFNKKRNVTIKIATARYCYSVWLRHLSILNEHSLNTKPNIVAELGPGDSIGVGLVALFTGSQKYYAMDVVNHINIKQNVKLINELIDILLDQTDIPNEEEFPRVKPILKSYDFPSTILKEDRIKNNLHEKRIDLIKESILNYTKQNRELSPIRYFCPWYNKNIIIKESVDMIYSQAVLEHVEDLKHTYEAMHFWLKKGGVMSHQIDFKSHGISNEWNGHWTITELEWKLIKGKKTYLINREPLSKHTGLLKKMGFKIISILPIKKASEIRRNQLANRFKNISEEDFTTSSAHILSIKL